MALLQCSGRCRVSKKKTNLTVYLIMHFVCRITHINLASYNSHKHVTAIPKLCPWHLSSHLLILFFENSISHFYYYEFRSWLVGHRQADTMKNVSHLHINEISVFYFFRIFTGRYGSELFVIQTPKNNNEMMKKSVQNKENYCPKNNRIAAELLIMVCEQFEVPHTHVAFRHCSSSHVTFYYIYFLRKKKRFSFVIVCHWFAVRWVVRSRSPTTHLILADLAFYPIHTYTHDDLSFVDEAVPKNAYISQLILPPHSPHAFFDRSHRTWVARKWNEHDVHVCRICAVRVWIWLFSYLGTYKLCSVHYESIIPWHFPISFSFDAKITHYFCFLSCNNTHESCFGEETTANGGNGIEFNGHMLMSFNWSKFVAYILHDLTISWTVVVEPNK